jgi:hypothetical protein
MFEKAIKETGYRILLHETSHRGPRITNPLARVICQLIAPFVSGFKGADHHFYVLAKV